MESEREREREIRRRLSAAFAPTQLEIEDQSARHAGHAGVREHGGGHFAVTIRSAAFAGKCGLERHRMVYAALGEMMRREIHAIRVKAISPDESA